MALKYNSLKEFTLKPYRIEFDASEALRAQQSYALTYEEFQQWARENYDRASKDLTRAILGKEAIYGGLAGGGLKGWTVQQYAEQLLTREQARHLMDIPRVCSCDCCRREEGDCCEYEYDEYPDGSEVEVTFPAAALEQAAHRTGSDGLAAVSAMALFPGVGHYNYPMATPKVPQVGDKRPEIECRGCKNKGHVVVREIEVDFHSLSSTAKLFCKLCGKDQL